MGKSKWVGQSYVFKHLLLNSYSAPRKWSPNLFSQNVHGYQIKDLTNFQYFIQTVHIMNINIEYYLCTY